MLDIHQILKVLPHRYPFLLVDRILEMRPDFIVGIKNVTMNEPFFQGHFPELPVMPGVLIIESMAQTGAVLLLSMGARQGESFENKLVLFTAIERARFRKPVVPGDQLRIEIQVLKNKGPVWKVEGRVMVDGAVVAEAILMCHVAEKAAVDSGAPAAPAVPVEGD
jgi:3-hydroxyacyl-[acyl-carrier-protein] dehydratase